MSEKSILRVTPVPCLQDNYAYLLECSRTGLLAVVDPSSPEPVLDALDGRPLSAIFNTHHHWDHVGGNQALLEAFPGIPVYGYVTDRERIPGQTVFLEDGQSLTLGDCGARVYHIPGHTLGAIAYHFERAVFTGDTLFLAGCGRLFEGTPAQMFHSLERLAQLPPNTQVYCGHEYTLRNLEFAAWIEPGSSPIQARLETVRQTRAQGRGTQPGTLAEELSTNPFLRARLESVRRGVEQHAGPLAEGPTETFAALRRLKDSF